MVQLFKAELLGIGSYGAVCRAKSGELLCAAKIINPNLLDPTMMYRIQDPGEGDGEGGRWTKIRWFEQESEFLFKLRHPNLVQYLGLYRDKDTGLPVLLMELLANNLTHYLRTPGPILYHVQVNICRDVAKAVLYLYANNIIHKNLCSNNVLLTDQGRAKVSDFGMATLADLNPHDNILLPFLSVRDKVAYMPPEAVRAEPIYTEKMDCFSFGVIVVQILTRRLPDPGDRWRHVTIKHPGLPEDVCTQVSEVERRRDHIDLIDQGHSLLPIALDCLKDKARERPSAEELCKRLATLKESSEYVQSVKNASVLEQWVEVTSLDSRDKTIKELQAKIEKLTKEVAERDHVLAKSREDVERLKEELCREDQSQREKARLQVTITEEIPGEFEEQSTCSNEIQQRKENGETTNETNEQNDIAVSSRKDWKGEIL